MTAPHIPRLRWFVNLSAMASFSDMFQYPTPNTMGVAYLGNIRYQWTDKTDLNLKREYIYTYLVYSLRRQRNHIDCNETYRWRYLPCKGRNRIPYSQQFPSLSHARDLLSGRCLLNQIEFTSNLMTIQKLS